jgi:hypothetical protein
MATRRKAVKIDDCQRVLEVRSPATDVSTLTVHVPDLLMRANRRQYTQTRAYDLRVKIANEDSSGEANYEIYTLSNAWWVKRSIEMAKGVYMDATKKERASLGEGVAKYNDFIIQCATGAAGNFADLYQYSPASSGDDMTAAEVTSDESLFEVNQVVSDVKDDDGDTMGFTVTAEDKSGVGVFNIFNEYLLSRNITPDADTRTGPYADLFELDEDALDTLQKDGDQTPWDADAFPSPFVLVDTISIDQGIPTGGPTYSRTFTAPLGIVILKRLSNAGAEANFNLGVKILLDVRKGAYKGVHAPAYKAMKGKHHGLA